MSLQNSTVAASAPMDPFGQAFTLYSAGGTAFNITIPDLDDFILYNVVICINYAAQLGASMVLLMIVLLMTSKEKRGSPVFILNTLSLTINTIRNILLCLYFTGPFSEAYAVFANDFSRVPQSAYATSIAAAVLTLFLCICVEISLVFQVRVVCITLRKSYRHGILIISSLIALLAIGFRFALCVENSMLILSLNTMLSVDWLNSAATITTSISICWFCAAFIIKLAFALNERRKLGLRQFGPMQILFIMGCQTLIVPAIFSILQYIVNVPSISSNVLTLVCLFLPLSALWASASVKNRASELENFSQRRRLVGSYNSGSSGPSTKGNILNGPLSPANTDTTKVNSLSPISPVKVVDDVVYKDLEAQRPSRARHGTDDILLGKGE